MSHSKEWLEIGAYMASKQKNDKFVESVQDKEKVFELLEQQIQGR